MKDGRNTRGRNNRKSTSEGKKSFSDDRNKKPRLKRSDDERFDRGASSRTARGSEAGTSRGTGKTGKRFSNDFGRSNEGRSRRGRSQEDRGTRGESRFSRSSEKSEGYGSRKRTSRFGDDRFEKRGERGERGSSYSKKRFEDRGKERSGYGKGKAGTEGRGAGHEGKRPPRLSRAGEGSEGFERRRPGKPVLRKIDDAKKFSAAKPKKTPVEKQDDTIRLNRYIANAGICSRREADVLISSGEISVNGTVITEMGYKVKPGDTVKYGNRTVSREKPVYVLMNKPKGYITTTDDPEERKIVTDLLKDEVKERIYPVGRLDRNTTGLLLLTNDGELAEKLSHPSNEVKKIYQVELDRPVTKTDLKAIVDGLQLEDGLAAADEAAVVSPDKKTIGIEMHIGRNRIVRRMFEHLGYDVVKLDRVMYAGLTKKDLPRGSWRFLTEKEVVQLKYFV